MTVGCKGLLMLEETEVEQECPGVDEAVEMMGEDGSDGLETVSIKFTDVVDEDALKDCSFDSIA